MSEDVHHHSANEFAPAAAHLPTALTGQSLQKSEDRENRLCLDVNLKYYVVESPWRREIGKINTESDKMREEDKGNGLFNGEFVG